MTTSIITHPYPISGPYMDAGKPAWRIASGYHSRVIGADGRYVGSIRPYPGNLQVKDILTIPGLSGASDFTAFRYALLQKGTTVYYCRGFIVRCTISSAVKLLFIYYDDQTSTWGYYEIASGVSSTASISCASNGRWLYVAVEGSAPVVVYWDTSASALTKATMGPIWETADAPALVEDTGSYQLPIGSYDVAYRFYDSTRPVYSGMSARASTTTTTASSRLEVTITTPTGADAFDRCAIYRTISVEVAGALYDCGILYWETTVSRPGARWGATVVGYVGTMSDTALVQQDYYDPEGDAAGTPPTSGAIGFYQGTTFMADAATTDGGRGRLRWANLYRTDPENFPTRNTSSGSPTDGQVQAFVEAGDILYAFTACSVWRLQRVGTRVALARMHYGRSLTSPRAAHAVGQDVAVMTPSGLGIINGSTGDLQLVGSVDRIILDDWKSTLAYVESAYDSAMDASFFVNTATETAIVVWHVTKLATLLEDCAFVGVTSGPSPTVGGASRAYFLTSTGVILTPDKDGTGSRTMNGLTVTPLATDVWGACDEGGTLTTLTDSTRTFTAQVVGCYVHVYTASGWVRRKITGYTTHAVSFASAVTVAAGDPFVISPVILRVRFKPLMSLLQEQVDFERVIVKGLSAILWNGTGYTDNDSAIATFGVYRNASSTLVGLASAPLDDGNLSVYVSADGRVVEPCIEIRAANVNYELTSFKAEATITVSNKATD